MMEFDREGLIDFIVGGEKNSPPVFVGRQDVLDDIIEVARWSWSRRDHRQGSPGVTRIVRGAPGAGKNSILGELEKRLNSSEPKPGAPRILVLDSARIAKPDEALRRLAIMVIRAGQTGSLPAARACTVSAARRD